MALAHGGVVQVGDERQGHLHVLHRVLEALVRVEVLDALVHPADLLEQALVLLSEEVDVDRVPAGLLPLVVGVHHNGDHIPHVLQASALLQARLDLLVLSHVELKQLLELVKSRRLRLELHERPDRHLLRLGTVMVLIDDLVGSLEVLAEHQRHVLAELRRELRHAVVKHLHLALELVRLVRLRLAVLLLGHDRLLLQVVPQQRCLLELLEDVVRRRHSVLAKQLNSLAQRLEHLVSELRAHTHITHGAHHFEKCGLIVSLNLLVQGRVVLVDERHQVQDSVRHLVGQVFFVHVTPLGHPKVQRVLDRLGIHLQPPDNLRRRELLNLLLQGLEARNLGVETAQRWLRLAILEVTGEELLKLHLHLLLPQVRERRVRLLELVALLLGLRHEARDVRHSELHVNIVLDVVEVVTVAGIQTLRQRRDVKHRVDPVGHDITHTVALGSLPHLRGEGDVRWHELKLDLKQRVDVVRNQVS
mmetsp:Transcript_13737/g.31795  ORF Transcript_13737/g.31795 Transcript_13737/m.31795 type:complete len:475 (+) Transcript_13737:9430-10854(+)